MKYKKGSIVPRSLVRLNHMKLQYKVKFNCDVEVINRTIYALSDGYVMKIPESLVKGKYGKPNRIIKALIKEVMFVPRLK